MALWLTNQLQSLEHAETRTLVAASNPALARCLASCTALCQGQVLPFAFVDPFDSRRHFTIARGAPGNSTTVGRYTASGGLCQVATKGNGSAPCPIVVSSVAQVQCSAAGRASLLRISFEVRREMASTARPTGAASSGSPNGAVPFTGALLVGLERL